MVANLTFVLIPGAPQPSDGLVRADRLNPTAVVQEIADSGRPAFYEPNADAIVERISPMLQAKDVVVVFSNGGFDNIHEKLLDKLKG